MISNTFVICGRKLGIVCTTILKNFIHWELNLALDTLSRSGLGLLITYVFKLGSSIGSAKLRIKGQWVRSRVDLRSNQMTS